MKKIFYSNGKLLITGEYLVLDGADALAIPTKKGQSLSVEKTNSGKINWTSIDESGKEWFSALFDLSTASRSKTQNTLVEILKEAQRLNPSFLKDDHGREVVTHLEFKRDWGLGSSSTLINNIAQWANVDAHKLLINSFGGSGYDVAVAQNKAPIIFKLENNDPQVKKTEINWNFTDQLYFVHLNKKQSSKASIAHYRDKSVSNASIEKISELTRQLLASTTIEDFEQILSEHERVLSNLLQKPTISSSLFNDYPRVIKSLGGWGGDFVLVTANEEELDYFRDKGYTTMIPYSEMIL